MSCSIKKNIALFITLLFFADSGICASAIPAILSLEELHKLKVTVASSFDEEELTSSASVSILTPQQWNARGDRSTSDALSHTTGAIVIPTVLGGHAYQVRGYSNNLSARGSATLIDDIPINTLQFATSVYTTNNLQRGILDRIEVIRGPGSALYGTDAFHSAVSFVTFKSDVELANISVEAGAEGFYQASAKYAKPISEDLTVNVALGASGQDKQDLKHFYTDPVTGDRNAGNYDENMQDFSAIVKTFNREDAVYHYEVSVLHNSEKHPSGTGLGAQQDKPNIVLGSFDLSGQNTKFNLLHTKLSNKVSGTLKLKIDGYYWRWHGDNYLNLTDASAMRVMSREADLAERKWGIHAGIQQQLPGWNTQWTLLIGTSDHKQDKFDNTLIDILTSEVIRPTFSEVHDQFSQQKIDDLSFEGRTEFANNSLTLTYGFRLDKYPEFGKQLSPRLSTVYKPDKLSAIKVIYGNAFRAPTPVEKTGTSTNLGDPNLDPEELDSLEFVYMRFGERWKSEIVLYTNEYDNGITVIPRASTAEHPEISTYANFQKNSTKGLELNYHYLGEQWLFSFNTAYAASENDTLKLRYTAHPKWIVNSDIGYTAYAGIRFNLNLRLFDGHYLGDRTTARNPETIERGHTYFRADLHASKSLGPTVTGWINIKNLFDRDNTFPAIWNANGGIPDIGVTASVGIETRL